ncbi:hypothetical protein [Saccharomonospora saliphila]|uniref:hypothetical protein n=1 Tax=Saccharomonospora saliphila TaxID=369829 RepID=UPI000373D97D|nr:hypothetical protein [Saccharomonospora saliphila]
MNERDARHHREWLGERPELLGRPRAGELSGQAPGCGGAPKPGHADVLVDYTT